MYTKGNKKVQKVLKKYNSSISDISDLIGDNEPSALFYLLIDKLGYLLDNDPEKVLSKDGVALRKKINKLIKLVGKSFLSNPQVIENRKNLLNEDDFSEDDDIILPNEPVIWTPNHAFKDDTLATILAIKRNAYILFGSLPQFYNTFDGVTAWLNGSLIVNRKVKESKHASVEKAVSAINYGSDIMMFPEGVWNKTSEKLMLDLWPGVYRICKETGVKVVPVAHYIKDCYDKNKKNVIHTVVDDAIRIDDLSEKAALEYLRDVISTWYYLMLERYGKSTREAEINGYNNSKEKWEKELEERIKTAARYDSVIEHLADYRPKEKRIDQIWKNISNIDNITAENINMILDAKKYIKEYNENDFQRRY